MNFSPSSKTRKKIQNSLFLLGILLFAYLVYRLKPEVIWRYLQLVGWKFGYIAGLGLLWNLGYTYAWQIFLKELNPRIRFWDIFRFKVSGEAVNNVTPLNWGGGDPVRIYLLKHHVSLTGGTASVVVDRTINNFAVALMLLIGVALTLYKFSLPLALRVGLPAMILVILLACLRLYHHSREGLFSFLLDLMKKLRLRKSFSPQTLEKVQQTDQAISQFYRNNRFGFYLAFGIHFACRFCGVIEIYLTALFLHHPLTLLQSYLLASMTVLLNMLFVLIPGGMGVLEGAYAGIFLLGGMDPAVGTSIQIIRRARMILWTGIGFLFLSFQKNRKTATNVP